MKIVIKIEPWEQEYQIQQKIMDALKAQISIYDVNRPEVILVIEQLTINK